MFQLVPIVSGSAPLKSTFLTIHPQNFGGLECSEMAVKIVSSVFLIYRKKTQ